MSTTKIGGNTTNILANCYFSKQIYALSYQTKCLHKENYFTFHKQYLIDLISSRNAKKTHKGKGILQAFLLCLKRNVSQTLKIAPAKKYFPRVYIFETVNIFDTCFNECFYSMWLVEYIIFYTNLLLSRGSVNCYVAAFFETSALKEVQISSRYLHINITMLLITKVQNKASTS